MDEISKGIILNHAIKINLTLPNVKCIFYNFNITFELIYLAYSKIDWNYNILSIFSYDFNIQKESYKYFLRLNPLRIR